MSCQIRNIYTNCEEITNETLFDLSTETEFEENFDYKHEGPGTNGKGIIKFKNLNLECTIQTTLQYDNNMWTQSEYTLYSFCYLMFPKEVSSASASPYFKFECANKNWGHIFKEESNVQKETYQLCNTTASEFRIRFPIHYTGKITLKGFPLLIFRRRSYEEYFTSSKATSYGKLFATGLMSDFKFIVEGREIRVHKNILALHSKVFEVMFCHKTWNESDDSSTIITDVSYAAFKQFLEFVYAGKKPDVFKHAEEILWLSEKYDFSELKVLCESALALKLNENNLIPFFELAELYKLGVLKTTAIKLIKKIFHELNYGENYNPTIVEVRKLFKAKTKLEQSLVLAKREFFQTILNSK